MKCIVCEEQHVTYELLCAECWSNLIVTEDYLAKVIACADSCLKFKVGNIETASWVGAASRELTSRLRRHGVSSLDMRYARPRLGKLVSRIAFYLSRVASAIWALETWLCRRFGVWPQA